MPLTHRSMRQSIFRTSNESGMKSVLYAGFFLFAALLACVPGARAATNVSGAITGNTTWNTAGSPYVVTADVTVDASVTLTVDAGVTVKFQSGKSLVVNGTLDVNGTSGDKAYFTSYADDLSDGQDTNGDGASVGTPGDWERIVFNSGSSGSDLAYAVVRFGGATTGEVVVNGGTVELSHAHVSHSAYYGVYTPVSTSSSTTVSDSEVYANGSAGFYAGSGSLAVTGSSIHDHAAYGVFMSAGTLTLTGNAFEGNYWAGRILAPVDFTNEGNAGENGSGMRNGFSMEGELSADQTWNPGIPYVVDGGVDVPDGVTLTVTKGTVVKGKSGGMNVAGTLLARGRPNEYVTFTSYEDDAVAGDTNGDASSTSPAAGDFGGIGVLTGGEATVEYAAVNYAATGFANFGGTLRVYGARITSFSAYGVRHEGGDTLVQGSGVANGSYGVYVAEDGENVRITHSSIHGMSNDGALNASPDVIDAEHNWWGDASGPYHATLNSPGTGEPASDDVDFDPWLEKSPIQQFSVAVLFADLDDVDHVEEAVVAQPCKLIPEKTYANGHDSEYYADLMVCVQNYFLEQSYGTLHIALDAYDNAGDWYALPNSESYYAEDTGVHRKNAFDLVDEALTASSVSASGYDAVIAVHAGQSRELTENDEKIHTWMNASEPSSISLAEFDPVGAWIHEIGHAVGQKITPEDTVTPDLYNIGMQYEGAYWDLMSIGVWNGTPVGANPSGMSSYTKEFLGWLQETRHAKSAYDTHEVRSINTSRFGESSVFRYNLEDSTSEGVQRYYLLEARKGGLGTWDDELPQDDGNLLLYYVNTFGHPEYGYTDGRANNMYRHVSLRRNGVLDPDADDTYVDHANKVRITAVSDETADGEYSISAEIAPIDQTAYAEEYRGVVLERSNVLLAAVMAESDGNFGVPSIYGPLPGVEPPPDRSVRWREMAAKLGLAATAATFLLLVAWRKMKVTRPATTDVHSRRVGALRVASCLAGLLWLAAATCIGLAWFIREGILRDPIPVDRRDVNVQVPDAGVAALGVHLHLYCDDGRHVGMNYVTGEFENQVEDSIVSGEQGAGPEWIYIPADETGCAYSVSSHDNAAFLAANPGIAGELADDADEYDLYARYVDPADDIYTSALLSAESIEPGAGVVYEPAGTTSVSAGTGTADAAKPETEIENLSGTEGANGWYAGNVEFALAATDSGAGVSRTYVSYDGGAEWEAYEYPEAVEVATQGETDFRWRSVDRAGNAEDERQQVFLVDSTAPDGAIYAPSNESSTNLSTVTASGVVYDADSGIDTVFVNGTECEVDGDSWECEGVPLGEEGENQLEVTYTDVAGNFSQQYVYVTLDTEAPVASIDGGPSGTVASDEAEFTYSVATQDLAGFECQLDSGSWEGCTDWSGSAWHALYEGLAEGAHLFEVRASDVAGNVGAPDSAGWTVDTTP